MRDLDIYEICVLAIESTIEIVSWRLQRDGRPCLSFVMYSWVIALQRMEIGAGLLDEKWMRPQAELEKQRQEELEAAQKAEEERLKELQRLQEERQKARLEEDKKKKEAEERKKAMLNVGNQRAKLSFSLKAATPFWKTPFLCLKKKIAGPSRILMSSHEELQGSEVHSFFE